MEIILASRSPRRKELLSKIIPDFKVEPGNFDESTLNEKDPLRFVTLAAIEKAKDVGNKFTADLIIGADTIISFNNKIIGKPADIEDARNTLKILSNNEHKVITGIALYNKNSGKLLSGIEITDITFKKLSDKMIDSYIKDHEVLDKAGSYAIQEIGDKFIKKIKGDQDNVIGLPVKLLKELVDKFRT